MLRSEEKQFLGLYDYSPFPFVQNKAFDHLQDYLDFSATDAWKACYSFHEWGM